ncbi:MAG: hypothetical protein MJ237_06610 [bacterium]|nr:hypothetical protein [bacterium]
MIDGIIAPALRDIEYLAPCAPYPQTQSGIVAGQNSLYRYSVPTEEQPTLSIVDYIPDYNGNFINPGYYKLALSDNKEFLYLIESGELIAIIPVFKLAENQSELKKYRAKESLTKSEKKELKKEEKKTKVQEKFKKIIDEKYTKTGATPQKREYEYMNASIEYIKDGRYYLIMYEKGFLRAWGAIKIAD